MQYHWRINHPVYGQVFLCPRFQDPIYFAKFSIKANSCKIAQPFQNMNTEHIHSFNRETTWQFQVYLLEYSTLITVGFCPEKLE
jgi:hypothetical protein